MSDPPKGRRASERRKDKSSGELPVESTTPGQAAPNPADFDEAPTAAADDRPGSKRGRVTSITSMTSVASASQEALKQEPLERTKVRQWEESPEQLGARLICLDGRDVGKSFDLTVDRIVVGRGKENHVRLSDPTTSREHFELRYDLARNKFFFNPLVTDPLPQLNGEEAGGSERELSDGDVIEIGETSLRFVRVDGPPPQPKEKTKVKDPDKPAPDEEKKKKPPKEKGPSLATRIKANAGLMKKLMIGAAVVAVVAVGGGVFGFRAISNMNKEAELNDPGGAYQKLLATARELRESRRWEELAATGGALTRLAPDRPDGARLEKEARDEQTAEKNLNLGRMNYTSGQYDAARSVLKLIPDSSVYRAERDKLLEQSAEVGRAGSLAAIQQLMAQGRYEEANAKAEQHLATYRDDEEARSIRAHATRQSVTRQAMGSSSWQATRSKAIASLDSGDLAGALALAEAAADGPDASHATTMASRLRSLQSEWRKGRDLLARKSAKAVDPLVKARQLEHDVTGGKSSLAKDITKSLGDAYYLAGIDAFSAGNECEARVLFDKALAERGSDSKITDKLSRIAARGSEMLGRAEAARARGDKSESMKLGREAVCRLPRGEEDRTRAEKLAAGKG